jgi:hypothetical protein
MKRRIHILFVAAGPAEVVLIQNGPWCVAWSASARRVATIGALPKEHATIPLGFIRLNCSFPSPDGPAATTR